MKTAKGYSIKELRQICQATAPNPEKETLAGKFCRIFAIYTTKLFLYTKITPNQITAFGSVLFFVGSFMYFGSYKISLLGPLFYFLSIVVDGSDGEVARFRKKPSKFKFGSRYAEPVSHDFQYGFFFLILSIALFYQGASPLILIFGALASITKLLYRMLKDHFWKAYYEQIGQVNKEIQNKVYEERSLVARLFYWTQRNIFSYPATLAPLLVATIFARMDIFILFYFVCHSLLLLALFTKHIIIIVKQS